jgi:hypothetical protein
LRVGIAAIVRGFDGNAGSARSAALAGTAAWVSNPAATAPPVFKPVFKNARRSLDLNVGFMQKAPRRLSLASARF